MCYTETIDHKGLQFSISNCFGFGFDWKDEEFVKAVNSRDGRLWEILEWAANGGAEEFNQAANFEELMSLYKEIDRDLLNCMQYESEKDRLDNLLENNYLPDRYKNIILEFRSGELARRVREAEPKKKPMRVTASGFVYLILAENGLYKIGKAKNVTTRLKPFTVSFPMKWELVHTFQSNDYSTAEAQLHEMFSDKRDVGEWFRLSTEDVEHIKSIQDGGL